MLLYCNEVSLVSEIIILDVVQGRHLLEHVLLSILLLTIICYHVSPNHLLITIVEIPKLGKLFRDVN